MSTSIEKMKAMYPHLSVARQFIVIPCYRSACSARRVYISAKEHRKDTLTNESAIIFSMISSSASRKNRKAKNTGSRLLTPFVFQMSLRLLDCVRR